MMQARPMLPVTEELPRPELVRRLAVRWTKPVTLVVAGPGFGKTILLAQAVRDNAAEPRGTDGWVSCRAGYEQAEHLALAICEALGGGLRTADSLSGVLDALLRHSPLQVCVIVDDAHEIPAGSSSARLLADLVRRLPANAHLVLAGRQVPPVPLARLRAEDRLGEITQDELAFTPDEAGRLAARFDRDPAVTRRLGGWPALVRLALAVRQDVAVEYAREEVLAGLCAADRRMLFALATAGVADGDLVARITGAPVDLEGLADRVPLISRIDDSRFQAHDLWLDALVHSLDAHEVRELQVRAVDQLAARGDLARAGTLAVTHADWEALSRVALELVRTTISVVPVDVAGRWLKQVPQHVRLPGLRLLEAAVRSARDYVDRAVDPLIDETAAAFRCRGDPSGEVVALALGTVAAQSRGDTARLVGLAVRATEVPGADRHPVVRLAMHGIAAVVAEAQGEPEVALEHLAAAPLEEVSVPLALAANRWRAHCLLLAGRADEAVAVADRGLSTVGNHHSRQTPALARWLAGDPSGFLNPQGAIGYGDPDNGASARDEFFTRAVLAVILASRGQRSAWDLVWDDFGNARDAALLTNARAAHAIVDHDEAAARSAYRDFLARHPVTERVGERHLRRFLALGYVLNEELRACWDAAALGPSHERARAVARALLATRHGQLPDGCDLIPPQVVTVLPLPWSVELACRLHSMGSRDGQSLAGWLVDHLYDAARAELRVVATSEDAPLSRAAAALLGRLPTEPGRRLEIAVIGPLEVRFDGVSVTAPNLRRARVRELLAVLVVEPTLSRDRAIGLLWPDLDVADGARNLRVTLSYLRRLLEPQRPAREASFHLRADTSTIRLFASPKLTVDLWEFRRLTTEAARAREQGDVSGTIERLAAATSLWRGAPLTDLDRVPGFGAEIERIRVQQVTLLLTLGRLQFAQDATAEAFECAERALAIDPFVEQAHRLAIAASLQRRDPVRVSSAVQRLRHALNELGMPPEPTTAVLLRHATAQQPHIG
jgi:LuxR family transcriptional regulator, maltose regulon positive regulatory protein